MINKTELREALRYHFFSKDYDTKLNKSPYALADEVLSSISHLIEPETKAEEKKEEWVTISGIKYKLEEIK